MPEPEPRAEAYGAHSQGKDRGCQEAQRKDNIYSETVRENGLQERQEPRQGLRVVRDSAKLRIDAFRKARVKVRSEAAREA